MTTKTINYRTHPDPEPCPGLCVGVAKLPDCDLCTGVAKYDAATRGGPWANMCERCFGIHAASKTLGVGKGQRLVIDTSGRRTAAAEEARHGG